MGEILDFSGSIGEGFETTHRGRLRVFAIATQSPMGRRNGELAEAFGLTRPPMLQYRFRSEARQLDALRGAIARG